jgi:hypothetical protein
MEDQWQNANQRSFGSLLRLPSMSGEHTHLLAQQITQTAVLISLVISAQPKGDLTGCELLIDDYSERWSR